MQYSNPQIPEGINTTKEHPLKEFSLLIIGALVIIVLFITVISLFVEKLARYIPFHVEIAVTDTLAQQLKRYPKQEVYLQQLAESLAATMNLPEDITITVHYNDADVVNAYATLGGHIVLYQGLISKLNSENALAMVMAHEIAHIKHRDPIVSLGRGTVISLALSAIPGVSGNHILGEAGLYTLLKFSRDMESTADYEALLALQQLYGHVAGAEQLFQVLQQQHQTQTQNLEFLQTHPLTNHRLAVIQEFALEYPQQQKPLVPLAEVLRLPPTNTESK